MANEGGFSYHDTKHFVQRSFDSTHGNELVGWVVQPPSRECLLEAPVFTIPHQRFARSPGQIGDSPAPVYVWVCFNESNSMGSKWDQNASKCMVQYLKWRWRERYLKWEDAVGSLVPRFWGQRHECFHRFWWYGRHQLVTSRWLRPGAADGTSRASLVALILQE